MTKERERADWLRMWKESNDPEEIAKKKFRERIHATQEEEISDTGLNE